MNFSQLIIGFLSSQRQIRFLFPSKLMHTPSHGCVAIPALVPVPVVSPQILDSLQKNKKDCEQDTRGCAVTSIQIHGISFN